MQIVDAQIHLWTNDKAPPHHRQKPFLIEDALREMNAAGVDRPSTARRSGIPRQMPMLWRLRACIQIGSQPWDGSISFANPIRSS